MTADDTPKAALERKHSEFQDMERDLTQRLAAVEAKKAERKRAQENQVTFERKCLEFHEMERDLTQRLKAAEAKKEGKKQMQQEAEREERRRVKAEESERDERRRLKAEEYEREERRRAKAEEAEREERRRIRTAEIAQECKSLEVENGERECKRLEAEQAEEAHALAEDKERRAAADLAATAACVAAEKRCHAVEEAERVRMLAEQAEKACQLLGNEEAERLAEVGIADAKLSLCEQTEQVPPKAEEVERLLEAEDDAEVNKFLAFEEAEAELELLKSEMAERELRRLDEERGEGEGERLRLAAEKLLEHEEAEHMRLAIKEFERKRKLLEFEEAERECVRLAAQEAKTANVSRRDVAESLKTESSVRSLLEEKTCQEPLTDEAERVREVAKERVEEIKRKFEEAQKEWQGQSFVVAPAVVIASKGVNPEEACLLPTPCREGHSHSSTLVPTVLTSKAACAEPEKVDDPVEKMCQELQIQAPLFNVAPEWTRAPLVSEYAQEHIPFQTSEKRFRRHSAPVGGRMPMASEQAQNSGPSTFDIFTPFELSLVETSQLESLPTETSQVASLPGETSPVLTSPAGSSPVVMQWAPAESPSPAPARDEQMQPSCPPRVLAFSQGPTANTIVDITPEAAPFPHAPDTKAFAVGAVPRGPDHWHYALRTSSLQLQHQTFDPTSAVLREQLMEELGASPHSVIKAMEGFSGGLNEGIWFLSEPSKSREELTLKLVRGTRKYPEFPTEAENLLRLHQSYPSIVLDGSVSFPFHIVHVSTASSEKYDLLVMRKAPGQSFTDHISLKCCFRQMGKLQEIMGKIGECLQRFHSSYGNQQHGDLQPSNIFYDEQSDRVTFIDLGGIGIPTMESDSEHFQKSMRLCYGGYGPELMVDGMARFLHGMGV